jgi:hypothetical protein
MEKLTEYKNRGERKEQSMNEESKTEIKNARKERQKGEFNEIMRK